MSELILPKHINCGYCNCSEFHDLSISPKRIAQSFEIEFFLEDGLITYLNGKELPIRKNYIIIAKPGMERYSLLPFKTLFLKFHVSGQLCDILSRLPDYYFALHNEHIKELLYEIISQSESELENTVLLGSKILLLISYLQRDAAHDVRGTEFNYHTMHAAKKYIEVNYAKKISTCDIAKAINLSESRLRCIFNIAYGISPHQHLINTRIAAAKELLWNTDIPITQVAQECGFSCQQYLNEIFKRETGTSPGKYRRSFAKKYNTLT